MAGAHSSTNLAYCRVLMRFAGSLTWQTTMHRTASNAQWLDHPTHRNAPERHLSLERLVLTYDFRLPPGPRTAEYALLAEDLGFRAAWCPEIPAFGHDIWVTIARIAERRSASNLAPPC